ncbi:hypothetical protein [Mycobacterium sp. DL592]|uniref:hypothetical protein n=1 Tax=Mycobacterium sp. DL592 TaxID=2675524 RepID=UPI001421F0D3|nr:hypothetical protein [Mycobacterium sp. DL592]
MPAVPRRLSAAAVAAAAVVTLSPVQPAGTLAVSPPRSVSVAVQLAADPITALVQVATETADNIAILATRFAANPTPVLSEVIANQIAYTSYLSANPTPSALLAVATSQVTNLVNALGAIVSLEVLSRVIAVPTAPLLSLVGGAVVAFQDPLNVVAILAGAFLNGVKVPNGPSSSVQLFGVFTPGGATVSDTGGSVQDVLDIPIIVANAIKPFVPPVPGATASAKAAENSEPVVTAGVPTRTTGASGRSRTTTASADKAVAARSTATKAPAHSGGSSGHSARTAD